MALFWEMLLKTVFLLKWLYFGKFCLKQWFSAKIALYLLNLLKTVLFFFFFAKIALFEQKLVKTVFSGQNGFILAKAG